MSDLPIDRVDDSDEESTGAMAEALSGVAAMLRGDEATDEVGSESDGAEGSTEGGDEFEIEINEDSPFAAAAAIFQKQEEPAEESEPAEAAEAEAVEAEASEAEASEADVTEAPAAESAVAESDDAEAATADEGSEDEDEEPEELLPPASPYDLPGSWYVVHSYSGYENKVKANLSTRIKSMHMEDSIFDIVIPMEEVVEIKSGRKVTVDRKQFPGYILVRMYMDDDSWGVVRNTPGVTGFVGSGTRPTPLSRREVERILGVRKDEDKKTPRFKPDWEVGETVRVLDGPFADFNGIIEDINVDQSKVRVLVDIFGRETPVELNFEQIQKF